MCAAKENPIEKNVRGEGKPIEKMCAVKEILLKSWKKPHNLRTIPGTAGNPGKKPHNITDLLGCCCWFRQAVQRPPVGAINHNLMNATLY